jgi:hypothetical protein
MITKNSARLCSRIHTAKRRAFSGLAGSPLATCVTPAPESEDALLQRLNRQAKEAARHRRKLERLQRACDKKLAAAKASKSDHTLRVPKTADREEPVEFDVWFDLFGQRHGRIDLDCAFQEHAFDSHLGGAGNAERSAVLAGFGVDIDAPTNERIGVRTGLLPGERERKPRRSSLTSWWIFEAELLKEFLREKWDEDGLHEAEKAAYVLHLYYLQSRTDAEIAGDFKEVDVDTPAFFQTDKDCKSYRQFVVRRGCQKFSHLYTPADPAVKRGSRRGKLRGMRCDDPNCTQCLKNEVSMDFR